MSYQSMNDTYRNVAERGRYEMAASEQAHLTFAGHADPAQAALADLVIRGDMQAIDAVIRGISTGPNGATLSDDAALLGAVQETWPRVSQAYAEPAV